MRYVVECWDRHSTAHHEQPARTLAEAREIAQLHCSETYRAASVRSAKDGRLLMHYWRDAEGLQYIEY